jgi:predicted esterase
MLLAAALLALAQIAQPAAHASRLTSLPEDAIAYVPASAGPHPPLLVLLHGAGHRQREMLEHMEGEADARGIVLLAPASRGISWDSVLAAEEPPSPGSALANARARRFTGSEDANRVEAAIAALGRQMPVDRARAVLAGFSDGATFALAMGMARSHAFAAVIAWSPGIAIRTTDPAHGRKVFVSHGRRDPLLRFDETCGEIVPMLQSEGAAVTFLPFDGGHEAPAGVKDAFLDALFGRVAGSLAMPLAGKAETCMPPTHDERVPGVL